MPRRRHIEIHPNQMSFVVEQGGQLNFILPKNYEVINDIDAWFETDKHGNYLPYDQLHEDIQFYLSEQKSTVETPKRHIGVLKDWTETLKSYNTYLDKQGCKPGFYLNLSISSLESVVLGALHLSKQIDSDQLESLIPDYSTYSQYADLGVGLHQLFDICHLVATNTQPQVKDIKPILPGFKLHQLDPIITALEYIPPEINEIYADDSSAGEYMLQAWSHYLKHCFSYPSHLLNPSHQLATNPNHPLYELFNQKAKIIVKHISQNYTQASADKQYDRLTAKVIEFPYRMKVPKLQASLFGKIDLTTPVQPAIAVMTELKSSYPLKPTEENYQIHSHILGLQLWVNRIASYVHNLHYQKKGYTPKYGEYQPLSPRKLEPATGSILLSNLLSINAEQHQVDTYRITHEEDQIMVEALTQMIEFIQRFPKNEIYQRSQGKIPRNFIYENILSQFVA